MIQFIFNSFIHKGLAIRINLIISQNSRAYNFKLEGQDIKCLFIYLFIDEIRIYKLLIQRQKNLQVELIKTQNLIIFISANTDGIAIPMTREKYAFLTLDMGITIHDTHK